MKPSIKFEISNILSKKYITLFKFSLLIFDNQIIYMYNLIDSILSFFGEYNNFNNIHK